ncbi:MAG: N-acetylglucosamine kinase [Nocardioidaceae bacterium]
MGPDPITPADDRMVLGGDVGGTSTRVLTIGWDGSPLGRGSAGGGNPVSHPDTAAAAFGHALREALAGLDPARVRAAVVGMAGGSALQQPTVRDAFARVWREAGVRCAPTYVTDLEVAFAAGTAEADGTVLIAGTGAVAGSLRQRHLVRIADGHGWLLGDDGSGFWLGREAARATLRTLDAGERLGPLAESVLRELNAWGAAQGPGPNPGRLRVIHRLNTGPPVLLAELAPLVTAAHAAGDPVAQRIVEEAARLLAVTVGRVRRTDERTPIVLAGGLAARSSPVGARLRSLVAEAHSGPVCSASDGAAGAAWLALSAADAGAATEEARLRLALT